MRNEFEEKFGKYEKTIKYKPIFPLIVLIALGIAMISIRNPFGYFVGGFFFLLGFFAILTKDRKVCELYEKGIVVYDENEEYLTSFDYKTVKEWNIGLEQENSLWFRLDTGREVTISSLNLNSANIFLRKNLLKKETKYIKEQEESFAGRLSNPFTGLFVRSKNEFSSVSNVKESAIKEENTNETGNKDDGI